MTEDPKKKYSLTDLYLFFRTHQAGREAKRAADTAQKLLEAAERQEQRQDREAFDREQQATAQQADDQWREERVRERLRFRTWCRRNGVAFGTADRTQLFQLHCQFEGLLDQDSADRSPDSVVPQRWETFVDRLNEDAIDMATLNNEALIHYHCEYLARDRERLKAQIREEERQRQHNARMRRVHARRIQAAKAAILFGTIGLHKFLLRRHKTGFVMLLCSAGWPALFIFQSDSLLDAVSGSLVPFLPGCLMGFIGILEGLIYLNRSDERFYAIDLAYDL